MCFLSIFSSYMDSEDADTSGGLLNGSLGREIMKACRRNNDPSYSMVSSKIFN